MYDVSRTISHLIESHSFDARKMIIPIEVEQIHFIPVMYRQKSVFIEFPIVMFDSGCSLLGEVQHWH
jgi:hypothetical protein